MLPSLLKKSAKRGRVKEDLQSKKNLQINGEARGDNWNGPRSRLSCLSYNWQVYSMKYSGVERGWIYILGKIHISYYHILYSPTHYAFEIIYKKYVSV